MKKALLLFVLVGLSSCQQHLKRSASQPKATDAFQSIQESRDAKQRFLRQETEARARSYEKQGYRPEEARALAEVEYFRTAR